MNKRIQEIHQECIRMVRLDKSELDVEKFADLIVEELRNVLADEYRKTPPECCAHFLRADEAIVKHFYGVKEHKTKGTQND